MQVVLYGLGKKAELSYYYFTHDSPYEVVAFCVEEAYIQGCAPTFLGLPVVSLAALHLEYPAGSYHMHIAVGQFSARKRLFEMVKEQEYCFANYISSRAQT
ncbi:hypothetical protein DNI29_19215 [Hymenobacter sediminis]|uniref:hypothetical protein n=1 Tax=Hymenobacter sediminis TaxID=2218621 RepID=UPI000DA69AE5|nr:hypothetical protein [Hymenobacter sediminis]RPD44840.1 hypothetical protein DNI29_19215 [Hymenobacter sediminis]